MATAWNFKSKAQQLQAQSPLPDESKKDWTQICLKMSKELLKRCDTAAREASMSRSAYIKFALNTFLKSEGF